MVVLVERNCWRDSHGALSNSLIWEEMAKGQNNRAVCRTSMSIQYPFATDVYLKQSAVFLKHLKQ